MPAALTDFARRCNATVAGDKWPWYVDYIKSVLAVFPEARFIYNVRDPRGLWNSAQRFKGRHRGDELLGRMLAQHRQIAPYLQAPNFFTVRYEDLVRAPERTCRRLYEFLGCDFAREYLYYDRQADPYPDRWDWVPEASHQFDPWHAIKWKEQMNQDEIERVTARAGWFIDEYRYER
jgi:hypothetical protein